MIRSLQVKNFCSLRETARFDATVSASTATDDSFAPSLRGDQVSVLAGVFGPNASGKTNFLKAFSFLKFFLFHSYQQLDADAKIPVDGFAGQEAPVEFDLEFEGNGALYRYELTLTATAIRSERLRQYFTKTNSFRTILQRTLAKKSVRIKGSPGFTDTRHLSEVLNPRANASVISAGLLTGRSEFKAIASAFGHFETNVFRDGKQDTAEQDSFFKLVSCARYFQQNDHLLEDLELRLQQADLGISSLEIREITIAKQDGSSTETVPFPFLTHQTEEGSFTISLMQESSGTKRLFSLLRSFLPVLTEGGIAVIDEMESDLHPHLIPLLLDLFTDQDTNPKRAQLIFTCHHVEILNHLAKEQIFLVNKDEFNASTVTRLSDIKGVRRDENHFSNYNAGRYRAIPEPEFY
jgi:predicted ATP-dependent endonuclease of OLD family